MKSTRTIKNSEYRAYKVDGGFEVWLTSYASGAKLAKVSSQNVFPTEHAANEFIDWIKIQEIKYEN